MLTKYFMGTGLPEKSLFHMTAIVTWHTVYVSLLNINGTDGL